MPKDVENKKSQAIMAVAERQKMTSNCWQRTVMSGLGFFKRAPVWPKTKFMKNVMGASTKMGKELDIFKYLRRIKRMDAALELLLSKKKRTLLEYQDKVRYIIEVEPDVRTQVEAVNVETELRELRKDVENGAQAVEDMQSRRLMSTEEFKALLDAIDGLENDDEQEVDLVEGLIIDRNLQSREDILLQPRDGKTRMISDQSVEGLVDVKTTPNG